VLGELGVRGNLTALVRRAVIQGWTEDEFASHLVRTQVFRRMYPGLIDFATGQIQADFSGGQGFSAAVLKVATAKYTAGYDDFQAVARRLGVKAPRKEMFALAVRSDVSIEEFGTRLSAIESVRSNPGLLDQFNEQLKLAGKKPLDKLGFYKFVAGASAPDFYDTYQAATLRAQGLSLSAEEAADVARKMDSSLSPNMDLGKLVGEIRKLGSDIGPELRQAGITDADLVLLAAGQDPKGQGRQLEQIASQRRALGQSGQGVYAQQSSSGGMSIFGEDEQGY
jgi:hypothetical protein